jgi:hypothetical protein
MTALRVRCWGVMTSALYLDHLLEDGREFGADVGVECWSERVPDGSGIVRHNTSHGSAREINSVMACEVSVVGMWEDWGRRLVAARGIRRTIRP